LGPIPRTIPLFPLPDAVLFPHMPLPLHIFEPRYRRMVTDILITHKTIGMTLLRPGWEANYEGRPEIYPIGCAGLIEACETLPDRGFNIVLRGLCRFRILKEHAGEPYRLATVEALNDEIRDTKVLEAARQQVIAAMPKLPEGAVLSDLPHDVLINGLCQSLHLTPVERQSLLDCNGSLSRYLRLIEILEFKVLEQVCGPKGSDQVH